MKRFLAFLLLLTLLPVVPVLAEDEIDVPAVILEDTWVNDDFTMTFAADGTAVMTFNEAVHEGTWEYVNKLVYFHYQQYGDLTVKLRMTQSDGEYYLSCNWFSLQMKAVREKKIQEAKETAEEKLQKLKWKEEVTLDFMSFSLDNVKVYRSPSQMIDDYPSNYMFSTVKGKKFLVVYGTAKNLSNNQYWLSNMRARVVLDEKDTYDMDIYTVQKGDTYYGNSVVNPKGTAKLCLAAELPEDVADSFKTALVRFSLNNYITGRPQKDFEGDFFFQINIGEDKAKSARKAPARKKTYFEYEKNKSIPKPSSYMDAYEENGSSYQTTHPTNNKACNIKYFYIRSRFDGETPAMLVKDYVKYLKKEGLTVKKVSGEKTNYQDENFTFYIINKGKTPLGWIQLQSNDTYSATVYIIKK